MIYLNKFKILKNKYIYSLILFLIWVGFFDTNDILSQLKLRYHIYQLNIQKEYYIDQISEIHNNLEDLLYDKEKLEKFAREKYLMKNHNEELFIIVPEK